MKNKFKYFVLFPLMILIVILTLTYDVKDLISLGVRIPFGEAYWKDSLTNGIVTNKSIRMQPGDSLYYNGVTVTSGTGGGGIAASDNITFSGKNTFQYKTIFSDTLKADGLSLIDNARITSDLNVTGDVISDLNFLKGSSTSIGTISTDSLAFITNNTKRIIIDKNGYTNFTDTVSFSDVVIPNSGIVFPTVSSFLFWNSYSSKISEGINSLNYSAKTHNFLTKNGNNNTAVLDSANGLNLAYGVFTGNGSGLTSVDAITLKGQDTTHFARTDSGITEIFNSIVTFATTVTFTVSPVFSALVNFANGINVTGNATVSGDLVISGWIKNLSSLNRDQYEKVKIVRVPLTATPPYVATTFTAAHGITNWRTVTGWTCLIQEDSLNSNINPAVFGTDGGASNVVYSNASVDSINVRLRLPAAAVNLFNDTAKFRITYSDYDR